MLSLSHPMKSAAAAVDYYTDERKEDYYLNGIDKKGLWFGKAAQPLGLGQTVQREEFRNLLNGFSPDGGKGLVQNAGHPDRQACWDMTFNDPKAVSTFWAMSPLDVRRQIEECRREALHTTLRIAEEIGGITRTGPGGKIKEPAELLWATFQEGTSRAQDPHLHTHAVLINLGRRQSGTYGSISTLNLFRWKMALGAIYQADLASKLNQRLGLNIEPEKVGFGIRGVPQELCRYFSKRGQTIKQTMNERGLTGAVAAQTVAKATRPHKEEAAPDLLFAHWQEKGKEYGWSREQAMKLIGAERQDSIRTETLDKLVGQAVHEAPREKQARAPLIRLAAGIALQKGADGQTLFQSLTQLRMSDGRGVLWQPRWQDRTMSQHEGHHEQHEPPASRQSVREAGLKQEAAATKHTGLASDQADQRSLLGSLPGELIPPPRVEPSQLTGNRTENEPGFDQKQTVGSETKPFPTKKSGQLKAKERITPTDQQSAWPESAASGQKAQHALDLWDPPEEARQGNREQGHGTGNASAKNARQDKGRKKPDTKARPAQSGTRNKRVPERPAFIRIEWKQLFPKAPNWSPARKLKAPVIVVGNRDPRWWTIKWKKDFKLFEVRLQDRILFRNAPQWSPFYGRTALALRFTLKKSKWKAFKPSHKSKRPAQKNAKSKDQGHSH